MSFYKLCIYLFLNPLVLFPQINGRFIEGSQDIKIPFTITQFSTKHGLPQSQVIDIVTKKNGNLIIATANGVVEYNGFEFTSFITKNDYKARIYTKLFWHEKSKQLFGEELGGISYLLYPQYKKIDDHPSKTIVKDSIYSISKTGELYAASVFDLKFKGLANTYINNVESIIFSYPFFYISSNTNLYQFDIRTKKKKQLTTDAYIDFVINPYNHLVYGIGAKNICKINDTIITQVLDFRNKKNNLVFQDIDFINEREYFAASNVGLFEINDDYTDCYTKQSALPSQFIQCLYYNKSENCLFVGTGEKGLLKLQLKNCYSLSYNQGFSESSSLSSIIKTKAGDVLIGETGGNIYKVGMDTIYPYCSEKNSYACLAEIDGIVFAGTWGSGFKLIKDKQLIGTISTPKQLQDGFVHCAFKDSRGTIWIGTSNGISKGKNISDIRPFLQNKIKKEIITFYELKNGTLCMGGSNGAFLLNSKDEIIAHIDKKMGLEGKEVRSFYEDKEGKLWIGTYDGGLYCYYKNKLTSINKLKNAMLDRDAFCLAPDQYGYLYITSNHGLWRVNEKNLSDFYYGKKKHLVPFFYGEETGILNTEFNGGFQNNYLKTKHNHFYFPSLQGVVVVTPEELVTRKLKTTIDEVYINDTLYSDTKHILERNTFSVQFDFSCVNFLNKYNVYYQYKLEGQNHTEWSPLQKNKFVNFKLLPAGKYTFYVRAIDAFNDDRPPITEFYFEIRPYFYETLWFKLLVGIIIIIIITIAVSYRIKNQKRKIEQKEFYKRKISEVELNAIQAQLNPHFIFNCMNTIKYFILEKDFTNANDGLNKLSKLIRSSLENSEDMFVLLEQELTYITNYVELEKMRLQDHLQYTIFIEPNISKTISVPHLLIQPYIENAIKHGISNLEDKSGNLTIEFSRHEHEIICTIIDNGIGRIASRKLNMQEDYHASRGTQLAKEKSNLLNQYYNYKCTIEIVDLYNENKISIGTKVIIKMPEKHESSNN